MLFVLVGLAACSNDQDPGIVPNDVGGSEGTSNYLQRCPDGGPDETTPSAGCLDEDGAVLRP